MPARSPTSPRSLSSFAGRTRRAPDVRRSLAFALLTHHFVWRQAREGLIGPDTQEVFLVSEVLGEVGRAVAEAVVEEFRAGLQEHFGVAAQTFLVDAQHRSIEW